ncbi:low molecular weight protein-tyrosine-phosphatase [Radiobacillus sp. PE A8.2]|uniref:low molecular weight protein-tyrosine-phosphatase n=1 Tax=Radiobacillus sp. PE A8.2 TaxID=3380349 RepID=UPI00388E79F7
MVKVLFLCLGNICRSPMAEAVFRDMVRKQGLENEISIDSAGIGKWHVGNPPHIGTRKLLDGLSISYEGMKARQIQYNDWDEFDYIIAMDDQNITDMKAIRDQVEGVVVGKLMEFAATPAETNVPDPYFTDNFDYTYELVKDGCKGLLNYISQNDKLS